MKSLSAAASNTARQRPSGLNSARFIGRIERILRPVLTSSRLPNSWCLQVTSHSPFKLRLPFCACASNRFNSSPLDKSNKTVTVVVTRRAAHPSYGKQVTSTKKYHAHDEKNEYRVGDVVRIVETRPLSKTKRWRVLELITRPE